MSMLTKEQLELVRRAVERQELVRRAVARQLGIIKGLSIREISTPARPYTRRRAAASKIAERVKLIAAQAGARLPPPPRRARRRRTA